MRQDQKKLCIQNNKQIGLKNKSIKLLINIKMIFKGLKGKFKGIKRN